MKLTPFKNNILQAQRWSLRFRWSHPKISHWKPVNENELQTFPQSFKGDKVHSLKEWPVSHRSETAWISHLELRNFSFHRKSRSWCCWRIRWLKSIGCNVKSLPLFHCFVNSKVTPISALYCFHPLLSVFIPVFFNIWIYALRYPVTSGWGDSFETTVLHSNGVSSKWHGTSQASPPSTEQWTVP